MVGLESMTLSLRDECCNHTITCQGARKLAGGSLHYRGQLQQKHVDLDMTVKLPHIRPYLIV